MPFDPVCCASVFPGANGTPEEDSFVNAIMVHHSKLTPSPDEQQAVASLVTKVTECLEAIAVYPGKFEQNHIEETRPIGSFKKGTMLAGHCVADLVVILRALPTFEATSTLGQLLKDEFLSKETDANGDDDPEVHARPYGFDFAYLGATIRVAFSTHQSMIKKTNPEIHISAADQLLALAGIRHARWAEENASHPNVKALIRILKDFRRRFLGFNYLSPWHLDLLAFYAVMQNPSNQPLSLPTAFSVKGAVVHEEQVMDCTRRYTRWGLHTSTAKKVPVNSVGGADLRALITVTVQTIEKDTSEDLPGDVEQQYASVIIAELTVPLPLVEMDDGRVFEILRNLRVIQVLSAGLFLPGSAGFIDPCEPNNRRVHSSIPLLQKDEICCAAQTICRIIGQNRYSVLFDVQRGTSPMSPESLASLANKLPGLEVLPSETVYVEPTSTSIDDSTRQETDEDIISEVEALDNNEPAV
ncbi:unnamed protein product [Schistocephalus solidus]|uniref:DZF domain-containing protein n=1 Tax=Schistocephalus solidus TaxID=70667 RepID=A0A183SPM1_SCHSO|nr:unnamed protein product [Schistocephalus solidus]